MQRADERVLEHPMKLLALDLCLSMPLPQDLGFRLRIRDGPLLVRQLDLQLLQLSCLFSEGDRNPLNGAS